MLIRILPRVTGYPVIPLTLFGSTAALIIHCSNFQCLSAFRALAGCTAALTSHLDALLILMDRAQVKCGAVCLGQNRTQGTTLLLVLCPNHTKKRGPPEKKNKCYKTRLLASSPY